MFDIIKKTKMNQKIYGTKNAKTWAYPALLDG